MNAPLIWRGLNKSQGLPPTTTTTTTTTWAIGDYKGAFDSSTNSQNHNSQHRRRYRKFLGYASQVKQIFPQFDT